MKILLASTALFAALTVQASADVNDDFRDAAVKCWNAPSASGDYKIIWDVEIDGSGELIDITSALPRPEGGVARAASESLRRAIMRCAPYSQFKAGTYRITLDDKFTGGKSLDPYK